MMAVVVELEVEIVVRCPARATTHARTAQSLHDRRARLRAATDGATHLKGDVRRRGEVAHCQHGLRPRRVDVCGACGDGAGGSGGAGHAR